MAKSRIGLDLNAALEDDAPPAPAGGVDEWSDGGDEGGEMDGEGDDADSDDGLFSADALKSMRATEPPPMLAPGANPSGSYSFSGMAPGGDGGPSSGKLGITGAKSFLQDSAAAGGFDMGGFLIRDGNDGLMDTRGDASPRPPLINLPISEFPPGTKVWIGDPNDVVTVMRADWDVRMEPYCGGKRCGTVVRTSGDNVFLRFEADSDGVEAQFSMPRACLFKRPISPYEIRFDASTSKKIMGGGGLGPRAGHDKKVREPQYGMLAPVDRAVTIGSPHSLTEQVMDALMKSEPDAAEHAVTEFINGRSAARSCGAGSASAAAASGSPTSANAAAGGASGVSTIPGNVMDDDLFESSLVRNCRSLIAMAVGDLERADTICDVATALASDSITLCLRAWHVKLMTGQFVAALDLVNHAELLAPHEPLLARLRRVTRSFQAHDNFLKAAAAPAGIAATYRLERRVIAKRYFVPGDAIAQDEVLLSMPQYDAPTDRLCEWCRRPGPSHADPRAPAYRFCEAQCATAAWDRYLRFELDSTTEFPIRSARSMLDMRRGSERFNAEEEGPMIESAALAIRVWAILLTRLLPKCEELTAQQEAEPLAPTPPPGADDLDAALYDALDELGVAPVPDGAVFRGVTTNVEYQIKAVHAVLSGKLSPLAREVFDFPFFRDIVIAVHTYRKPIEWPANADGSERVKINVVTRASGGVPCYKPRPTVGNATLQAGAEVGEVFVVATDVIDPRSEIVIV